ncbi:hypothetical protein McanCB56680_000327 [Microsporum canis]
MSQTQNPSTATKAVYFGEVSPRDLRDLGRNAARVKPRQLAKAASYLEDHVERRAT